MLDWLMQGFSVWAIPAILLAIPLFGSLRGVKVYEAFIEGAGEGFQTSIRIIPALVAMLVAIGIFRDSGALLKCVEVFNPFLALFGINPELVPLAIMRPLSGSGALGMTTEILHTHGPDSLIGQIASTVIASTDTTFYIITVYFGAVGITKAGYSVFVGLTGDVVSFLAAVYVCTILFS